MAEPGVLGTVEAQMAASVFWRLAFHTEKESRGAWLLLNLPEFAFLHSSCQVAQHIICKPENYYYRITFPLSDTCAL